MLRVRSGREEASACKDGKVEELGQKVKILEGKMKYQLDELVALEQRVGFYILKRRWPHTILA